MSEKPQNYANHARTDPWFHFFIAPVLLIFVGTRLYLLFRQYPHHLHENLALLLLFFVLLCLAVRVRIYSLKVQDRVIRLEERIRLSALLPEALRARIPELTVRQLVALRFACDNEIPALVQRTLTDNLDPKTIKQSIQNWRPDHWRV